MEDKHTQIDADENIQEIIYAHFRRKKSRKISIPVIPTAYCFNLCANPQLLLEKPKAPSRCNSKKELKPMNLKRNNSECLFRPPAAKVKPVNISFSRQKSSVFTKVQENKKPEIKLRNVRYILRY